MNLNQITASAVGAINADVQGTITIIKGYNTLSDGTRVPKSGAPIPVTIQIQALEYNDLMQMDGLNIQGEKRKIYLNGNWTGLIRTDGIGGDVLAFPEVPGGAVQQWLCVKVLEHWAEFTVLAVTLQNGS